MLHAPHRTTFLAGARQAQFEGVLHRNSPFSERISCKNQDLIQKRLLKLDINNCSLHWFDPINEQIETDYEITEPKILSFHKSADKH